MSDDENKEINTGADLSGNLKDLGVKFQNSGWRAMKYYREPTTPKIIQWVMKYSGGLIKNEKQTQYALLGFVILIIIISLFLFFGTGSSDDLEKIIPKKEYIDPPKPWTTNL